MGSAVSLRPAGQNFERPQSSTSKIRSRADAEHRIADASKRDAAQEAANRAQAPYRGFIPSGSFGYGAWTENRFGQPSTACRVSAGCLMG